MDYSIIGKNIRKIRTEKKMRQKEFNLLSVTNVKGLEFETVYVLDKDMIPNEQYVAYTRALKDLTIIKD